MQKLLIATTNQGKYAEITAELADLNFSAVSLRDLKLHTIEVPEPHDTTWQNALEKARFFGKKTGLLTVAEDTGLFIDALAGAPGVKAKRFAPTAAARIEKVLKKLKQVPEKKRTAYFETAGCLYNPETDTFHIFIGKTEGLISSKLSKPIDEHLAFSAIFYYPPLQKTFVEMTTLEKNMISHRGKMTHQLKYFLMKHYRPEQIICAAGIIVKDRKMLLTKRRDLRPEFNGKWEFPGGGVENGETFDETTIREVREETGFTVVKLEQLPDILTTTIHSKKENYQVHLFMSMCKIKSGKMQFAEAESSDYGWFTYKQALKMDLLPLNKKVIQTKNNKKIILKYID